MKKQLVAISCSDLHFSHFAPPCRMEQDNWYEVQKRYIFQLRDLAESQDSYSPLPILCAGDLLDKWNPRHELVNFLIANLPNMYAIPGQHDLPYHNYQDIKKSAYWTLVESGTITNLKPESPLCIGDLVLSAFPYGYPIKPLNKAITLTINIALVHSYVFIKGCSYPGAPEEKLAKKWIENTKGYDLVLTGDNHEPWSL